MDRRRGSSLIEVMVASAILLAVLTATASAIAFGVGTIGHSRHVADAERIAAGQMEALIVEGHEQDPLLDPFGRFAAPRPRNIAGTQRFAADGRADAEGEYVAKWTVQENRPIVGGLRLRVDVSWREGGTPRSIGLTTYFVIPDPCDAPEDTGRPRDPRAAADPCDFSGGP